MADTVSESPSARSAQTLREKRDAEYRQRRTFEKTHRPSVHDDLQAFHRRETDPFRITVTPASLDVRSAKPSRVRFDIVDEDAPELEWLVALYKSMARRKLRIAVELEELTKLDAPTASGQLWVAHVTIKEPGNER